MTNPSWLGTVTAKLAEAKYRGRCYSTSAAIRPGDLVVMVRRCGELEIHSAASEMYEAVRELARQAWLDGRCGAGWLDVTRTLYPELFPA